MPYGLADAEFDPNAEQPPEEELPPSSHGAVLDAVLNTFNALKNAKITPDDLQRMIGEQLVPRTMSPQGARMSPEQMQEITPVARATAGISVAGTHTKEIGDAAINSVAEGIAKTGRSWKTVMHLLENGYEVTDPEVLKYAFDIALNMLPGGIAIKEGARLLQGAKPSEAPVAEDMTGMFSKKPPGGAKGKDFFVDEQGVLNVNIQPTKQDLYKEIDALHRDGLITAEEQAAKKKHVDNKFEGDALVKDDLGSPTQRTEHFPQDGYLLQEYDNGAAFFDKDGKLNTYMEGKDAYDHLKDEIIQLEGKSKNSPYNTPMMYKDGGQYIVEWKGEKTNFNTYEAAEKLLVEKGNQAGVTPKVKIGTDFSDLKAPPKQLGSEGQAFEPKYKVQIEDMGGKENKVTWYRPNKDVPGGIEEVTQHVDKNDAAFMAFATNQTAQASLHHAFKKHSEILKQAAEDFAKMPSYARMEREVKKQIAAEKAAKEAKADQVVKEVTDYFHTKSPQTPGWEDKWYHKIDVANSAGQLREGQAFGSWASQYASHEPDLVRAAMKAHQEGIGKVMYHDEKSGRTWILNMQPKDMKTAPPTAWESAFHGTRIDKIPQDAPHPGPIFAFHGTGGNWKPIETPRGKAEMEFAGVDKSADIGWHFGTAEQAVARTLAKSGEGKVMPVFLDVKKPFTMSDMGGWSPQSMARDMLSRLEGQLEPGKLQPMLKYQIRDLRKVATELEHDPYGQNAYGKLRDWLDKHGYDSIRYLNEAEGEGWSYIVWTRGKVKSAPVKDHTLYVAPGFPRMSGKQDQEDAN